MCYCVNEITLFHFTWFFLTFVTKFTDANYNSHWNIEYVPWKTCDFILFPLLEFTLVIKLRNFDAKRHWNTLIFFHEKSYYISYINMSHGKMSDLILFPLFGLTLVIKLRYCWFWKSLKYFNVVRYDYAPWNSVWFGSSSVIWVEYRQ